MSKQVAYRAGGSRSWKIPKLQGWGGCHLGISSSHVAMSAHITVLACDVPSVVQVGVIINDRVDVALAVGAHGVHVGQDDIPARTARQLLGPGKVLGVSVKTVEQALQAAADGADYLGAGASEIVLLTCLAVRVMHMHACRAHARMTSCNVARLCVPRSCALDMVQPHGYTHNGLV